MSKYRIQQAIESDTWQVFRDDIFVGTGVEKHEADYWRQVLEDESRIIKDELATMQAVNEAQSEEITRLRSIMRQALELIEPTFAWNYNPKKAGLILNLALENKSEDES